MRGPLNLAAFCDPSIDREIARAHSLHTTDPGAESQHWARIDRKLTDQAPWVAYANGIVLEVVSSAWATTSTTPNGALCSANSG